MTGPPAHIGPYEVVSELDRGGMGVVYVVRDPRLDRRIALKVLNETLARDTEWVARFQREARLLASLNHPNIATIHSLERHDDAECITMELITGESLAAALAAGPLALGEALSIARQVARGLEAAHGAGVIHRDLKPHNVMITPERHAKILDFGLATNAAHATAGDAPDGTPTRPLAGHDDETLVASARPPRDAASGSGSGRSSVTTGAGTPGYMSPEQVRGEAVDARTDIWAFGCILYECLSGRRALRGATPAERINATLQGTPSIEGLPAHVPGAIRDLVRACLQPRPDDRLASIAEARACLESALAQRAWDAAMPTQPARHLAADAVPHNLPRALTPMVGRARELARVVDLLSRERLVTLTGIGGGGKTRLALRAGEQCLERFPDGVFVAELAPVPAGDADGVTRAVARAMGVSDAAGLPPAEAVVAHAASRRMLLILDNCEHLVGAAAALAASLLASCPRLVILATSREALGLPGETAFQVPPLQVPATATAPEQDLLAIESVQLFAQRAAQARPDFVLTASNAVEVAEICRRLEGLPLAIELAAARTKVLSLQEIARRLDDRFRLLKGTSRSALPHHQTLEALIDWSHASLDEAERTLYRRLAVFRGGFSLEAAEQACADETLDAWEILDVLTRLIEKSLVAFSPGDGEGAAPRYAMLETVREHAQARLGESPDADAVLTRCDAYFAGLAATAGEQLTGGAQAEWLRRLDADLDNLRAVLARALTADDPTRALRMAGQLLRYWMMRGQWREGRATCERAVARPGAEDLGVVYAGALNALGSCCYLLNDLDAAARAYRRAVDVLLAAGERGAACKPLLNLGNVHRMRGDTEQAAACLHECLRHIDPSDTWMLAAAHSNLGGVALVRDEYDEARAQLEKAIELHQQLGDRVHGSLSRMNLGLVSFRQGRLPEARALFEECAAVLDEIGDRNIAANVRLNLGITLLAMNEDAAALAAFAAALRIVQQVGGLENLASGLEGMASVARRRGDVTRAAKLAGAADAIRAESGVARTAMDQRQWEAQMRAWEAEAGEHEMARLLAEGRALSQDAAIALGLETGDDAGRGSGASR